MRHLSQTELKTIYNKEELLKGCISRMCVTEDKDELYSKYYYAVGYLSDIAEINAARFNNVPDINIGNIGVSL